MAVAFVDAIAIAVALAIIFGPVKGSTQFHQREYVAAINKLHGYTYVDRLRRAIGLGIRPMDEDKKAALHEETRKHRKALLETGFLVERDIPINSGMKIIPTVIQLNSQPKFTDPYTTGTLKTRPGGMFAVVVVSTTNDVAKWEDVVRKADGQ